MTIINTFTALVLILGFSSAHAEEYANDGYYCSVHGGPLADLLLRGQVYSSSARNKTEVFYYGGLSFQFEFVRSSQTFPRDLIRLNSVDYNGPLMEVPYNKETFNQITFRAADWSPELGYIVITCM